MKAALIGCGKIAFWHVLALKEIPGVDICAVCDRDLFAAQRIAGFTESAKAYNDYALMLHQEKPDVVHVLTPPDSHADIAVQAMEAGCNVLVEKPMTVTLDDAERMVVAAKKYGVQLGTNHNFLYGTSVAKARELIKNGDIGQIVHVNGFYGISTDDDGNSYANTIGRSHWAWNLPGGAFINFLPHMVYLLLDLLPDFKEISDVVISREQTPGAPVSELIVLIKGKSASGVITFSLRTKPYQKFVDIYGTKGIIHADIANEIYIFEKYQKIPRQATKVVYTLDHAVQLAVRTIGNVFKVLTGKLKSMYSLRVVVKDYYQALMNNQEIPVTGEDGKRMVEVMETIFKMTKKEFDEAKQVKPKVDLTPKTSIEKQIVVEGGIKKKILVTGAAGFLGSYLTAALSRCGADVVALVRNRALVSPILENLSQVVEGDIRDASALERAMKGVDVVYHCAAVTVNRVSWSTHYDVNVEGVRTVFELAKKNGVKQLIHVSSVVVFGLDRRPGGGCFLEEDDCKNNPEKWAFYMRSKIDGEKIAKEYLDNEYMKVSIVRPGILYGFEKGIPGKGMVQIGSSILNIGGGNNKMPFIYIENAVDCLLKILVSDKSAGQCFNIVDDTNTSPNQFLSAYKKISGEKLGLIPFPPFLFNIFAFILETKSNINKADTPPRLTHYVIHSEHRNVCYSTKNSRELIGWQPEVGLEDSIRRTISFH